MGVRNKTTTMTRKRKIKPNYKAKINKNDFKQQITVTKTICFNNEIIASVILTKKKGTLNNDFKKEPLNGIRNMYF